MVLQGRAEIGEDAVLQDILRNTAEFASDPSLPTEDASEEILFL